MLIIDENHFNEIINTNDNSTTNHPIHHDLPLIESWIDFSECSILHQSSNNFIKSNHSNQILQSGNQQVTLSLPSQDLQEQFIIRPTTLDQSTTPSTSSSLTSPFCDQSSFLTLSPPPISLNDPLPITRTEYGLIDEFWSQISTTEHASRNEESDELLRFVVQEEEEVEALRRNQSIEFEPIETKISSSQSRIDPSLLSMNQLHDLQPSNPLPSLSSSSNLKLDQANDFLNIDYHPELQPQHTQTQNEYIVFEGFDPIPETQSPTQSIISSTHSSNQSQSNSNQTSSSSSSSTVKQSNQNNNNSRGGKKKDFLERNRLAASRSRAKRKQTETLLETRARVLEDQNMKLRSVVQGLEYELRDLKQVLFDVQMMS